VVRQLENNEKPNSGPIQGVLRGGLELIREQRERFENANIATQSDLMSVVEDLADA
jgi:hypothetical protein